jgi:hypothetical protein
LRVGQQLFKFPISTITTPLPLVEDKAALNGADSWSTERQISNFHATPLRRPAIVQERNNTSALTIMRHAIGVV